MMKIFLFALLFAVTNAFLKEDMDKLEEDLMKAHSKVSSKKSLENMNLDELVVELKRELKTMQEKDTATDTDIDFQKRFTHITENKKSLTGEEFFRETMNKMSDDLMKREDLDDDECKDTRTDCEGLKAMCVSHKKKLEKVCTKTCGFCSKCVNKYKNACEKLSKMGQCRAQPLKMREACPKSCNFCKAPAPPKCSYTKYGCCFDKQTTKSDAKGSNCPACQDDYRYVCNMFKVDCHSFRQAGDFMRRHCRETCGICASTDCVDHGDYAFYCPMYKNQLQWCVSVDQDKQSIMQHYCPKTCNYC